MLHTRPWWIALLSDDAAGAASSGVFDDGEPPAGDGGGDDAGVGGDGSDAADADSADGSDGAGDGSDAGDASAGGTFDASAAEKAVEQALEDEDPFADDDEPEGDDADDVADLLADDAEPEGDGTPEGKTDAKADDKAPGEPDAKADDKADDKAEPGTKDPATNAYADLDPFTFVEKVPKVKAADLDDIDKLIKVDIEAQEFTEEGIGAAIGKLAGIVKNLASRAEMTDAMLTRDVAAAKAMQEKQTKTRAETIEETLDRVAGPIVGEERIGTKGKVKGSQVYARQELLAKANEIAERHKAKGGDPSAVTLERVIKAAAVKLYGKGAATSKPATPAATPTSKPAKQPILAKPATPAGKPATPNKPAPAPRPRTTGDAEDLAFRGVRR